MCVVRHCRWIKKLLWNSPLFKIYSSSLTSFTELILFQHPGSGGRFNYPGFLSSINVSYWNALLEWLRNCFAVHLSWFSVTKEAAVRCSSCNQSIISGRKRWAWFFYFLIFKACIGGSLLGVYVTSKSNAVRHEHCPLNNLFICCNSNCHGNTKSYCILHDLLVLCEWVTVSM